MSYDSISPIDGRYRSEAEPLDRYFSDRALTAARVRVELAYLRLLVKLRVAPRGPENRIRRFFGSFPVKNDLPG